MNNKNNNYSSLEEGRKELLVLRTVMEAQLERLRAKDELTAMEIDGIYTELEAMCKESLATTYKLTVANAKYTEEILKLKQKQTTH